MQQIALNIKYREEYESQSFIVSKYNKSIYNALCGSGTQEVWGTDPYANFLLLHGKTLSGKTHLAHMWQRSRGAVFVDTIETVMYHIANNEGVSFVVDAIEKCNSQELLHMLNIMIAKQSRCLLTSNVYPMRTNLQDLNSRINSMRIIQTDIPNHEMVRIFLIRQFQARSIHVTDSAVNFLSTKMEHDLKYIIDIVDILDKISLRDKRKITVQLVKKYLNF